MRRVKNVHSHARARLPSRRARRETRVRRRIAPKRTSAPTTHRSRSLPRNRVVEFGTKIIMNFHTHRLKNEPSPRARVSPRLGVETRGRGRDAATPRVVIRRTFSHLNLARVRDRARARTSAPARRATGRCAMRSPRRDVNAFGLHRARARARPSRPRARSGGIFPNAERARASVAAVRRASSRAFVSPRAASTGTSHEALAEEEIAKTLKFWQILENFLEFWRFSDSKIRGRRRGRAHRTW